MILNGTHLNYEWQDNWGQLNGEAGFAHNDIAIDQAGRIFMSFNQEPYLRIFSPEGKLLDSFSHSGPEMHCLFITRDAEGEWLWVIDLANKTLTQSTLDGKIKASIGPESFGIAEGEKLTITSATRDPDTGNIWIADGYGGSYVYCFGPDLKLRFRFNGSESACGTFQCPHWIFADQRKGRTELYIADRSNHRIVVYDGQGVYLRTLSEGLHTPSAFSSFGDMLVVSELKGRIHVLDKEDRILETLGDGSAYSERQHWPNRPGENGPASPVYQLEPGKFNSPHGIAADPEGNIYVHEWLMGVRVTKLLKK